MDDAYEFRDRSSIPAEVHFKRPSAQPFYPAE